MDDGISVWIDRSVWERVKTVEPTYPLGFVEAAVLKAVQECEGGQRKAHPGWPWRRMSRRASRVYAGFARR